MKILITPRGFAKNGMNYIKEMEDKGYEVHYNDTGLQYTPEQFLEYAEDSDGIIVGVDDLSKRVMSKCHKLKVVCKFGVGTDNIDLNYAKENGILVGRTVGSNSNSVAEHVMGYIYSDAKNLYQSINFVKNHEWKKLTGSEIFGKTLGIIGFGSIGKQLARQAVGVGMKVNVYDVFDISKGILDEYNVKQVDFETILKISDYITLHLPLNEHTRNMISTNEFIQMKNNVCLINAARGGIVDEAALYQVLKNHEIRSAYFDVFSTEPPKEDNPLIGLDNFILTPHTAARTLEADQNTCEKSANIVMNELEKTKTGV